MNKTIVIIVGGLILLFLILFSTTYTVSFNEVAIVYTFGKADTETSVVRTPGLGLKLPAPVQSVTTFDTRVQLIQSRLDTVNTADGLQIIIEPFLLWRIDREGDGPLRYADSYAGAGEAEEYLENRLRTVTGTVLKQFRFDELIGENSRLAEAEQQILDRLLAADDKGARLTDSGIEPQQVGLSQVILPPETSEAVVKRMQEERQSQATNVRTEGEAEFEAIRSEGARDADRIRAVANQLAEQIRAEGDRAAADAVAIMNQDPEFATFLIRLRALEETAGDNATFFIPAESLAPFTPLRPDYMLTGALERDAESSDDQAEASNDSSEEEGAAPDDADVALGDDEVESGG